MNPEPKIFISYSWKPEANKQRVIQLAERLYDNGIHVVMDIWDLKAGQDKYHFMERMVNDPEITKVLMICNQAYAEKANGRTGGIGVEGAIISPEVYNQVDQRKFIPIVFELDENGNPYLPAFLKSTIYIDLSNEVDFEQNYDMLIRDIWDRPSIPRPRLGRRPAYLDDETSSTLPVGNKVQIIKNALLNNSRNISFLLDDYFDSFLVSVDTFAISLNEFNPKNVDEVVDSRINRLLPLETNFIEFLKTYITHSQAIDSEKLHGFLEKLLSFLLTNDYFYWNQNTFGYYTLDAFKFFYYELFIRITALLIQTERFELLAYLLYHPYLLQPNGQIQAKPFMAFDNNVVVLNHHKKQKYRSSTSSQTAETIRLHCTSDAEFNLLMEADILLYYISLIQPIRDNYHRMWLPETSVYNFPPQYFLKKMISKRYFEKCKILFQVANVQELRTKLNIEPILYVYPMYSPYQVQAPALALDIDNIAKYA